MDDAVPSGSFWQPRLFSVSEANALVPRLLEVFARVRAELDAARREGRDPEERVLPMLTEIVEIGIEVKAIDGLVDFRSRRSSAAGEEVVYLCWKFPEERITQWHSLDAGFAGRQPIANAEEFEGDLLQ